MSDITKRALAESLKMHMQHTPLDKITIASLVEDCGFIRQTFYYHFQDIYDLLRWIFKTEALNALEGYKSYETWQQGFLMVFQYVEDNKIFCLNAYKSQGREYLENFLHEVVFSLLEGVIDELAQGKNLRDEYRAYIAQFYTYAFTGLLQEWLDSGLRTKPKDITEKLACLIEGDFLRAVEKFSN